MSYMLGKCSTVRRARAAARGGSCAVHNGKVTPLAWKPKCALSDGRLDVEVNMVPAHVYELGQRATRARGRSRRGVHCPQCRSRHVGLGTKVNP
eukprot:3335836-Pyramimonas_sp.AAC.1